MDTKKPLRIFCIALLGLIPSASLFGRGLATSGESRIGNIRSEERVRRGRLFLLPEFCLMTNNGESLNSAGFGLGAAYGLYRNLALGTAFRQAFSGSEAAIFSQVEFQLTYAITGSLIQNTVVTQLEGQEVAQVTPLNRGGLRLRAHIAQYFFNILTSSVSFSGFGASLDYEFPSQSRVNYALGVRVDRISNGSSSLWPVQFFAGAYLWL